jgi:hypothetical protein
MKRRSVPGLVALILGLGLAGCSARPPSPTEPLVGVARWSCAPHDAPAVDLEFPLPEQGKRLIFSLWEGLPFQAGSRVEFDAATFDGTASVCTASGECESAVRGWIVFSDFAADDSASGTIEVELASGGVLSGSFDATWSPGQPLCG